MTCEYKKQLRDYLEEKLPPEAAAALEAHLASCPECQAELDRLAEGEAALNLLREPLEVPDEVVVGRIKARRAGLRRITVYGVLGFLLGLFSRFYTRDHFIVTKALMALPYKLAQFGLEPFFKKNVLPPWRWLPQGVSGGMGFFPYNPLLDFLAALFTPALVAAFGAMVIGYLVSDRRVFLRRGVVRFLAGAAVVFLLWTGVLGALYAQTEARIARLNGIREITVWAVEEGGGARWLARLDRDAFRQPPYDQLLAGLQAARPAGPQAYPEGRAGLELMLSFAGGGRIPAHVDPETRKMVLFNGTGYQLSPETIALLGKPGEVKAK
ncbi:zf-HC2 domain-containing protein [Gelria sp. Kuro-4]|uniref:zf-HC2 domain-containing protein n=1 Tax=Gelria sp. Kuro-4 TaxID=2796927 RepID=UPI001BEFB12B|nr:zf-HC2 domain-containing protein [Gelria sp. Kuro-4]BCV23830.1 hypothetical protein kuro4_06030 [Gelria sp. Kuro-4]